MLLITFLALVVTSASQPLRCADWSSLTITSSGTFDIDCDPNTGWWLVISGCRGTNALVDVRLLASPTRVLVSDNQSLIGHNQAASLSGCSVSITYAADTAVPSAGATGPSQAHVYVATASPLRALNVTLAAALHLEGSFVAVAGNNSGSVGHVSIAAPPSTSVICRAAAAVVCSANKGTSLLRLAYGCPLIEQVSIVLNGTNTTASMREAWVPASFALVVLDNTTMQSTTPTPALHDIVVHNVSSMVIEYSLLLTLKGGFLSGAYPYPLLNGTVLVSWCIVSGTDMDILNLDNPVDATVTFAHVQSTALLARIEIPRIRHPGARWPRFRLQLYDCNIVATSETSLLRVLAQVSNAAPLNTSQEEFVVVVDAAGSTFTARYDTRMIDYFKVSAISASPTEAPPVIPVAMTFTRCNFSLPTTSVRILSVDSTVTSHFAIVFDRVAVQQLWVPHSTVDIFTGQATVYPSVPLLDLHDAINTSIVFRSSSITVVQAVASPAVAPSLLSFTGTVASSSLVFDDTTVTVTPNISFPTLNISLINISTVHTTTVVLRRSELSGLRSVFGSGALIGNRTNSTMQVVDCITHWCDAAMARCTAPLTFRSLFGSDALHQSAVVSLSRCTTLPSAHLPQSGSISLTSTAHLTSSMLTAHLAAQFELRHSVSTTASNEASPHAARPPVWREAAVAPHRAAVTGGGALVLTSLVSAGGAARVFTQGAVPALQRASTALRLSSRCAQATGGGGSDGDMFSDAADNPTQLHFTVGRSAPSLGFAAGAVAGNALLVVAFASLSHVVRWMPTSATVRNACAAAALRLTASVLPSSPMPGALAGPFGILVQPAVAACCALISAGSADAVAYGVAMGCVWLSLPLYAAWELLWRARGSRLGGAWGLSSRPTPSPTCVACSCSLTT